MNEKKRLQNLCDSITKENFEIFKAVVENQTKETETVKKLYEKFMGKPIPEDNVAVVIKIGKDEPDYFVEKRHYPVVITEFCVSNDAPYRRVDTELHIDAYDSDIVDVLRTYGKHLEYRKLDYVPQDVIVHEYIEAKALKYGVDLDNDLYFKLRNFVEHFCFGKEI